MLFPLWAYLVNISHKPYRYEPGQLCTYTSNVQGTGRMTEKSGFSSQQPQEIFSPPNRAHRFSGPLNLPSNGYSGVRSPEVKRQRREADHSRPSSAKIKGAWSYTSTPQTVSWRDAYLSTEQLYLYLTLYHIIQ
jgi:hypothetical protein